MGTKPTHGSTHEACTEHSGITTKLNLNLAAGGLALLLLGTILGLLIDTNGTMKMYAIRLDRLEVIVEKNSGRLTLLEYEVRSQRGKTNEGS